MLPHETVNSSSRNFYFDARRYTEQARWRVQLLEADESPDTIALQKCFVKCEYRQLIEFNQFNCK